MNIRFADRSDCAAILNIYAQYIDTPVTFECTLPPQQEFYGRMTEIMKSYPYLVCEEGEKTVGYAYAHQQMKRDAYQWNAELSIYLDRSCTSRGLGKKLYSVLIDLLKLQGVKNVYGGVTVPNEKSEGLHKALGFRCLGVYHRTGFKNHQWLDVAWFEKEIAVKSLAPTPVLPLSQIPAGNVESIIRQYQSAE